MQVKLLHDLVEELAGVGRGRIVEILFGKKDVNEFLIAKKMELTINQVRNILYKLSADGLVSFIRKKDKRKGWYIYYWTLNTDQIKYLLIDLKKKKLEKLKERVARERSSLFFVCGNKCIRLNFDQGVDFGFKCPECGLLMNPEDNTKIIEGIEKEIELINVDT